MDIYPNDYKTMTDRLQLGYVRKVPHKNCSNSACLRVENTVEGLTFYCFKCGAYHFESLFNSPAERARRKATFDAYREAKANTSYELPSDFSQTIPSIGLAWLGAGGWTIQMMQKYSVGWSERLGRVTIPIVSNCIHMGYVARAVESWQSPKYLEKVKPGSIWESCIEENIAKDLYDEAAVICEDILSAGRCGEFIKGYSLLGTSLDTSQLKEFMQYKKIYLWLDPDKAGREGTRDMINRLRLFSEVISVNSEVDPKHLTNKQIQDILCTC